MEELKGVAALIKNKIDRQLHSISIFPQDDPAHKDAIDREQKRIERLMVELTQELQTKRIVVLATTHEKQINGHAENSALNERVLFLEQAFGASLVMEEWADNQAPSFLSVSATARLAYSNVGTPSEEDQFVTFVAAPLSYPGHVGILGPREDAPSMLEYGPIDNQENRELRMLVNIEGEMQDHHVGLLIIGLAHLHSMAWRLKSNGFNVTAYSWLGD